MATAGHRRTAGLLFLGREAVNLRQYNPVTAKIEK